MTLALVVGLLAGLWLGRPELAFAERLATDAAPWWTVQSNQVQAFMGSSVDGAGDVNGDGYDDVIVGAYQYDNGQTEEGRAYVYYGSPSGPSTSADWIVEADQAYAYFGISVAGAGDVNGDGYDDVIVGAPDYTNGQSSEGRAFLYYGSASGLATTAGWTAESDQAFASFGYSVSGAGDVDGDGYDDVIVGAPDYTNGQSDEGRAFVYHGSARGPSSTPSWTTESNEVNSEYGLSTGGAGDVDGDGYDDVIVGAPQFDGAQADGGRAFLYRGSPAGLITVADWTADGDQSGSNFASALAGAVDVNGDGYDDVVIGAPEFDVRAAEGEAFAYYGSPGGLSLVPDWTIQGRQEYARFGGAASGAGDVNADGFGDVAVGVWGYENGQIEEGRALIYCGAGPGLPATPCRAAESNREQTFFGVSVGGAGDVDADGYDDLIVGATGFSNQQYGEGGAVLIYGSPG